ncbi:unnamed protein product, partial [Rotaria sp. Silwood2]
MSTLLKQNHAAEQSDSNTNIINYVKTNKMNDRSKHDADYDSDVDETTSMEEDDNCSDNKQDHSCDSEISDDHYDETDEINTITTKETVYNDTWIRNSSNPNLNESYFQVKINNT